MVLSEPETSLHPDLLPALARAIRQASEAAQVIVVSHARKLIESLGRHADLRELHLLKSFGETTLQGVTEINKLRWEWPPR